MSTKESDDFTRYMRTVEKNKTLVRHYLYRKIAEKINMVLNMADLEDKAFEIESKSDNCVYENRYLFKCVNSTTYPDYKRMAIYDLKTPLNLRYGIKYALENLFGQESGLVSFGRNNIETIKLGIKMIKYYESIENKIKKLPKERRDGINFYLQRIIPERVLDEEFHREF